MAYFIKREYRNNKTYLAIYESFYNHNKKGTAHKCYQSFGSLEKLKDSGIDDPIAYLQDKVDKLNRAKNEEGTRKISDVSPIVHLGYFPLCNIMNKLRIKDFVDLFKYTTDFDFDLYDLLSSLIYARSVNPCSKFKTFTEVLPNLYHSFDYSYDQLLSGLSFIGNDYEKFVEMFTHQVKEKFGIDTSTTYFDCTNFFFEIDREDDFRRKGPSKENRKDPIIGLGLLLDANLIPIGMKMYPGNESEKPVLRDVIEQLKRTSNLSGRTIHVADKGINCAQNIAFSKKNGDGYLFSKSVRGLPETEKTWVLLNQDFKVKKDSDGSTLFYYKSFVDKFPYTFEHDGKKVTTLLSEKRLVTYNPSLATKKRLEIMKMVEKATILTLSQAKRNEFGESGKYVNFTDFDGNKAVVGINQAAIDKDLQFAGYNLLVTSEVKMKDLDMYDIYHNLWRIEESFKIMKSDLDARPVFLQKQETIQGHFLICYLTVVLQRLLQFKVLDNKYSSSEISTFIKRFKAVKVESNYINTSVNSRFIKDLSAIFKLPLTHYLLSDTKIKSFFNHKV